MVITQVEESTKDFIENNNIFLDVGDPFTKWIAPPIQGEVTYGIPGIEANIKKVKGANTIMHPNQTIYECSYSFDSIGRRTTQSIEGNKTEVALFFGDAMTFGEGVNDCETVASYYERLNNQTTSYNYGFLGHGPTHMLRQITSQKFKDQFKDTKGTVFYILRDDAIKSTAGQVPWAEGTPKYTVTSKNTLEYNGTYKQTDCIHEKIYLPSQFTEKDRALTVKVFEEAKNSLTGVSKDLELIVVIIPLTFSSHNLTKLLIKSNINYENYYYTDLEYLTDTTARYIDGIHTPQSNYIIAKKLTQLPSTTSGSSEIEFRKLETIEELKYLLRRYTFMLPCMVDFPIDDVGVIIAQLTKKFRILDKSEDTEIMELAKKWHAEKIKLIKDLQLPEKETSQSEVYSKCTYFSEDPILLNLFVREYVDSRYLLVISIP